MLKHADSGAEKRHKRVQEEEGAEQIGGLILLAAAGVLLAILSLVMQWPTPQTDDSALSTTVHLMRLQARLDAGDTIGMIMDALPYVLLLASIFLIVLAARRARRNTLGSLMIVALFGLAYASGMALYTGPMVSVCGFTLVLFGALVGWFAVGTDIGADEDAAPELPSEAPGDLEIETTEPTEPARPIETIETEDRPGTDESGIDEDKRG